MTPFSPTPCDHTVKASTATLEALCGEHREMVVLFTLVARTRCEVRRTELLRVLCNLIRLHLTVETGIFVPALSAHTGDATLLRNVGAEYAAIMALTNEIAATHACKEVRRARVRELRTRIAKHIRVMEASGGVLNRAEHYDLDWQDLEHQISRRREELHASWTT